MDETTTTAGQQENVEIRMATIAEIFEDGVTLIFDGQEEATDKHYKCNTSAKLAAGDRVMLDSESGTYVVAYAVGNPNGGDGEGSHEIPAGGTNGQVLIKDGAADYTVKWGDIHQVPAGGTAGQVLRKKSEAGWDLEWGSVTRDIPTGGTDGQVLLKNGATDYSVKWGDLKGLPTGGTLGQVLLKKSNANFDIEWGTLAGMLPAGGSAGQYLKKNTVVDYAVVWADAPNSLPTGGTDGQVLTKSGSTNYSVKWATPSNPLPTGGSTDQVLAKSSSTNYAVKWTDVAASQLKSGIYTLKLSGNTILPSAAGFSLGTSGTAVKVYASSIMLYYSSYKYCTLACNSSGKLTVNGTAVG